LKQDAGNRSRRGAETQRRGFDVEIRKKKQSRKFLPLRTDKEGSKKEQRDLN
jgi:hypothetical protein